MLEERGHRVVRYQRENDDIRDYGSLDRIRLAGRTIWSLESQRELTQLIRRERPQLAHVFNTFPLVSPSGLAACTRAGVPVVVRVANYRAACANAYLFRDGHNCEECLGRSLKWPAVVHGCYHDSRAQTAVVAASLSVHRVLDTWVRHSDVLQAVSEAVRDLLVRSGLPKDHIEVCHNMVAPDPGDRDRSGPDEGFALFVGRLSPEKGLDVLLDAVAQVPELALKIVGDGPERARVERVVRERGLTNVAVLGSLDRAAVFDTMRRARVLVVPSQWHEPFGHVVTEAFSSGLPVIASDLGAFPELITDPVGVVFPAKDTVARARALRLFLDASVASRMGRAARDRFLSEFTATAIYERTMEVYALATERSARRRTSGALHARERS